MITAYLISGGKVTQFNIRVPESQAAASVAAKVPVKVVPTPKVKLPRRDIRGRFIAAVPKPPAIEKNPFVGFYYPSSSTGKNVWRRVRVISADDTYLIGLKQNPYTYGWQFKKYFQYNIRDLRLSFNEGAMS